VLIGLRLGMACDRFAGEQKLGGCFDTVIDRRLRVMHRGGEWRRGARLAYAGSGATGAQPP